MLKYFQTLVGWCWEQWSKKKSILSKTLAFQHMKVSFKMFVPVQNYCSEVWGFQNFRCIEMVQNCVLRYYLGVHRFTPLPTLLSKWGVGVGFNNIDIHLLWTLYIIGTGRFLWMMIKQTSMFSSEIGLKSRPVQLVVKSETVNSDHIFKNYYCVIKWIFE